MLNKIYEMKKDNFSRSDHKIMDYLLSNEAEVQFITAEELSSQLGLSAATISRFWSKIGYQNIKDFKKSMRGQAAATPSSRMKAALSQWEGSGFSPERVAEQTALHIQKTFSAATPEKLSQAVEMLLAADRIYLYAPDASAGVAQVLIYRLRRLGLEPVTIPSGSQIYEFMLNINSHDLVLMFGYSRLVAEIQILLSHSQEAGYGTILFTDLMAHDLLARADLVLYSFRGEPNSYHSMAVPMILADLLVQGAAQAAGDSLERTRKLETLRENYSRLVRR